MRIEYIEYQDVTEDGWKAWPKGAGHILEHPGVRLMAGNSEKPFLQISTERDATGTIRIINAHFDDENELDQFFYTSQIKPNQPSIVSIA